MIAPPVQMLVPKHEIQGRQEITSAVAAEIEAMLGRNGSHDTIAATLDVSSYVVGVVAKRLSEQKLTGVGYNRNRPRPWLPGEVARLRSMRRDGIKGRVIALSLGRSVSSVMAKAAELIGENTLPSRYAIWSTEETERLRTLREAGLTVRQISIKLRRTPAAVRNAVARLPERPNLPCNSSPRCSTIAVESIMTG